MQQLGRIPRMYGKASTVEYRLRVQRGVPTAANSGQVDMASTPDCVCCRVECGTSTSRKVVDHPLQFLRLAKDVAQEVCHEILRGTPQPKGNRTARGFGRPPLPEYVKRASSAFSSWETKPIR